MGYHTEFSGEFELDRPLTSEHNKILTDRKFTYEPKPYSMCQWVPSSDGEVIEWDGNEKFLDYIEWLKYLIQFYIKPWGYTLNGEVHWQGENILDEGVIEVTDNEVKVGRYVKTLVYDK